MTALIEERWAKAEKLSLKSGSHEPPNGKMAACVMELASYVAGEPWSDEPECVCPVIGVFLRSWNDGLPSDAERDRLLKPLIPLVLNTRNPALEERRSLMAADWLIRTHTVAWLRLAKLDASADALAALPEITAMSQIPSIRGPIEAAKQDANATWAAARDAAARAATSAAAEAAAGDAARNAAWDAAWDAARNAAWDAAWAAAARAAASAAAEAAAEAAAAEAAAWDAARNAAWDAAWAAAARAAASAAAEAAAEAAARNALKETQATLQLSAVELVKRMCALTDASVASIEREGVA